MCLSKDISRSVMKKNPLSIDS